MIGNLPDPESRTRRPDPALRVYKFGGERCAGSKSAYVMQILKCNNVSGNDK